MSPSTYAPQEKGSQFSALSRDIRVEMTAMSLRVWMNRLIRLRILDPKAECMNCIGLAFLGAVFLCFMYGYWIVSAGRRSCFFARICSLAS